MERVSGKCGKVMFSAIPHDGLVGPYLITKRLLGMKASLNNY